MQESAPVAVETPSAARVPMPRLRTHLLRHLLRVLPAAALVAWVVVARPWVTLAPMLRQLPPAPIILSLAIIFLAMLPARTLRWRTALASPPSFLSMYAAQLEGQAANIFVGMGLADVVRTARLREQGGTFAEDFGTTVADRASEYLVLVLLLGAAACVGTVRALWLAVPVAFVAGLWLLVAHPAPFMRLSARWPRVQRVIGSMRTAFAPRSLLVMGLLAVVNWGAETVMLSFVLSAVGLPSGLALAAWVVVAINLAIAIPGPPANLGTFEAGVVVALASAGVSTDTALSFALFYHALFAVPVALVGGSIWTIRNVRRR